MPDPAEFDRDEQVQVRDVTEDSATLTLSRHGPGRPAHRRTARHPGCPRESGLLPVALRYCWPSELDLMAQLAGLRLRERYSDWTQTPFDAGSRGHISVYEPT